MLRWARREIANYLAIAVYPLGMLLSRKKKVIDMSELSQKGENIYQTKILPHLSVEKLKGKIVAIETESEGYFIEDTVLKAVMLVRKYYPHQIFL